MSHQFWRLPRVLAETGLSKPTLFRRIKAGEFPRGFKISARAAAWSAAEVENWKLTQLRKRDLQEAA